LPQNILLKEYLKGSKCGNCGSKNIYWTGPPIPSPWKCEGCDNPEPYKISNKELFNFLDNLRKEKN